MVWPISVESDADVNRDLYVLLLFRSPPHVKFPMVTRLLLCHLEKSDSIQSVRNYLRIRKYLSCKAFDRREPVLVQIAAKNICDFFEGYQEAFSALQKFISDSNSTRVELGASNNFAISAEKIKKQEN